MFGLGIGELLVVALLVLLFFGGNRLPKLGSSLGMAINNFKAGLKHGDDAPKINQSQETLSKRNGTDHYTLHGGPFDAPSDGLFFQSNDQPADLLLKCKPGENRDVGASRFGNDHR